MRTLLSLTLFSFLLSCSSHHSHKSAASQKQLIKQYKRTANKVIEEATKNTPSDNIAKMGMNLIEMAKPIISNFQKDHPDCEPLLKETLKKSIHMTKLDLQSIEKNYHDGEALPKSPEHCYEAKELIVHPATVVIIAKKQYNQSGREKIVDEIEEVIAHIDLLL